MRVPEIPSVQWLIDELELVPLPVEGGRFAQTWVSNRHWPGNDKPAGTAIMFLVTSEPGDFSALHRLPTDEVWHRYLGDPATLVQLHPGGDVEELVLGSDLVAGERVQTVVPAGTWMGCYVPPGGLFGYTLLGCTLAPGFSAEDYEGADPESLLAEFPDAAATIRRLTRPGAPQAMPDRY